MRRSWAKKAMLSTPARYKPKMMMITPPTLVIMSRCENITRPSTVAVAPSARKISEKPRTKSSPCTSAVRLRDVTSSKLSPVMKVM